MNGVALTGRVYQAIPDFEDHLEHELGTWQDKWGPLYYADQHNAERPYAPFWQQNIWFEPFRLEFDSISQAVAALRGIQRNWAPVLHTQFRRASLIESQLPPISRKPRPFPWRVPDAGIGAWTLLDAHTLIASPRCSSPFPAGAIEFEEDKIGPPSRAYLKLWEALVRCGKWPQPGQKCLDAGASPGGWTWALARLGAQVTAVDRAPLEDRVLAMPGVTALKHDAFTLTPEDFGPMDWVFSDVICYPPRLYEWIQKWLASGLCKNFVCTIKMQGEADYETTRAFAEIPGGTVTHLYHNKHELTWCKINSESMEEKNGQAKNIGDD
ncbi:methyltransferase [Spirochaetia bacterium]|nr:methyltransferase [Spirochaetia bacterium]